MKIYTKTGDGGTTSLFTGKRVHKNDPFVEALGDVDEGNSAIGLAVAALPKEKSFQKVSIFFPKNDTFPQLHRYSTDSYFQMDR